MAQQFLTDKTLYAGTLVGTDLVHVVDVSDTSQNPAGSSYKLQLSQLSTFILGSVPTDDLATTLAAGNTTGGVNLSITSADTIDFNVGSGGSLNSLSTASARTWNLPDASGTIALLSDIPTEVDGIYTGSGTVPSSVGVTLTDTLNFDTNTFVIDGVNNRVIIGMNSGTAKLQVRGDGLGSGKTLLLEDSAGTDTFFIQDNGYISGGNATNNSLTIGANTSFAGGVSNNTFIGARSGNGTLTGIANTGLGDQVLNSLTSGTLNVGVGSSALSSLTDGVRNTAVGTNSMTTQTGGDYNSALGYESMKNANGGNFNVAVGYQALNTLTTTGNNTAIGTEALYTSAGASNNTALGYQAGHQNSTGNSSVFLGYQAGYYETASNKLFIDNAQRASEADGRLKALMYGVFDAAVANQRLTINGNVGIAGAATSTSTLNVSSLPTSSAGLATGDVWNDSGTLKIV